ncbi:carboxylesterase family protein [Nocardia sp. NPDC052254]|uniref:carboxylesterase/lipase family protein n=1 Tax=Nocardia sp. NPDC052254 TaxID=3155681 RepID=UPI00342A6ADB
MSRWRRVLRVVTVLAAICVSAGWVGGCGGSGQQAGSAAGAVVTTSSGAVRGTVTADHRRFDGIPYAAAPIGALRWTPPEPHAHWDGTRAATAPGAECPQQRALVVRGPDDVAGDEDCLFLNVWTPARSAAKRRPVLVWIHGGAFQVGSGDSYDPSRLVTAGDMVVVTINYRLGALGFLADPVFSHDGGQVSNFGLLDQQAALRWVRDNIAAFGGDPARVTIAGESSGATSVCDHLISPASAGLFAAVVLQSGRCQVQAPRETAARISADYVTGFGCGAAEPVAVAQCMRALPPYRLVAAPLSYSTSGGTATPGPVTGQPLLPDNPVAAVRAGKAARVPVLIGTNHDEATGIVAATGPPATVEQYLDALAKAFGSDADNVAAAYPAAAYAHPASALAAAFTDHDFACPVSTLADALSRGAPVYQYEFDDTTAASPGGLVAGTPFPLGASHTVELPYLFGVAGLPDPATAPQQNLSAQMIAYWAAFVNTGNPHTAGQPEWPRHTGGEVLTLRPGATAAGSDFTRRHHCDHWVG